MPACIEELKRLGKCVPILAEQLSCDGVGNERSFMQGFVVGTLRLHANLSFQTVISP